MPFNKIERALFDRSGKRTVEELEALCASLHVAFPTRNDGPVELRAFLMNIKELTSIVAKLIMRFGNQRALEILNGGSYTLSAAEMDEFLADAEKQDFPARDEVIGILTFFKQSLV